MISHRLFVGTIGEGLWRSTDGGSTFRRACDGTFVECHVRALAVDPRNPLVLWMGSELGLFRSTDGASNWQIVESPVNGRQVWSILLSPHDPDVVLAGTCPSRVFRSGDGGQTWIEAKVELLQECPRILWTRVTCLSADPSDPATFWAGVEIDGLRRSRDGGYSWERVGRGLSSQDIHALAIVPGSNGKSKRILAATNNDLNISNDEGETWEPLKIGTVMPWSYCRALAQPSGQPQVVLLGNGDGPPGTAGIVGRSIDGGETWNQSFMPGRGNSTLWNFAVHPSNADLIYAASVSGQVYRSFDAGLTWGKLTHEFGEIRALAWAPMEE
jgi:photosystem II stability/assembly factor-like uncharacterized protein